MAADILLYKATHVPVGDDQKQHLELCRNISQGFNRHYKTDFLPVPEPIILETGARVMSLKDGRAKMSKSDPSDLSRINLMDSTDSILRKIQKAKTDSQPFPSNINELEDRSEIKNLIGIYAALSDLSSSKIIEKYFEKSFSIFKKDLFEIINDELSSVSIEMNKLLKDKQYLVKTFKRWR